LDILKGKSLTSLLITHE